MKNERRSFISKTMRIITAKLPYIDADYTNKDIHDTHSTGSIKDLFF